MSPDEVTKVEAVIKAIEPKSREVKQGQTATAAQLKEVMGPLTSEATKQAIEALIVCVECSDERSDECDYCGKRKFTLPSGPPSGDSWKDYAMKTCDRKATGNDNQHGHHVVPKKAFGDAGKKARNILCKYSINPFVDCENLVVNRNHCHNDSYKEYILSKLIPADQSGSRSRVVGALNDIANWHVTCGGKTGAAAANTESDD